MPSCAEAQQCQQQKYIRLMDGIQPWTLKYSTVHTGPQPACWQNCCYGILMCFPRHCILTQSSSVLTQLQHDSAGKQPYKAQQPYQSWWMRLASAKTAFTLSVGSSRKRSGENVSCETSPKIPKNESTTASPNAFKSYPPSNRKTHCPPAQDILYETPAMLEHKQEQDAWPWEGLCVGPMVSWSH